MLLEDEKTILPEYLQIDLVGEILSDFLDQANIQLLLKNVKRYRHATTFQYKFRGVAYTGSLFDQTTDVATDLIHHQLTIRLSHDGFRYPRIPDDSVLGLTSAHSGILDYQVIATSYLEKLSSLKKIQALTNSESFLFLYQRVCRRIDIEFYEQGLDSAVKLKICFEHGAPTGIRKKEYFQDMRHK